MKLKIECDHCDTQIEFTKKDIKIKKLWKKGDKFNQTKTICKGSVKCGAGYEPKYTKYYDNVYEVTEDYEGKMITCPVCDKVKFLDIEDGSGWWMHDYHGLKAMKIGTVNETEWYKR